MIYSHHTNRRRLVVAASLRLSRLKGADWQVWMMAPLDARRLTIALTEQLLRGLWSWTLFMWKHLKETSFSKQFIINSYYTSNSFALNGPRRWVIQKFYRQIFNVHNRFKIALRVRSVLYFLLRSFDAPVTYNSQNKTRAVCLPQITFFNRTHVSVFEPTNVLYCGNPFPVNIKTISAVFNGC